MGDAKYDDFRLSFERRLKLKFLGSKVTTDTGTLAYREIDKTLALTEMVQDMYEGSRIRSNKLHNLVPLLHQSIYSRRAGYEDMCDRKRLAVDPALHHVAGGRAAQADKHAASTSEVGRQ